jgi:hypothetical protein
MSLLILVMAKAKQRAEEQEAEDRTRDKTPQKVEKEEVLVIGSSCTWKREDLDHFGVVIEKDIDVRRMIPARFFSFEHLEEYTQCDPLS